MKNSEAILKVAHDLRRARIDAIVAPLRKKAQDASQTPTINALAQEAKAKGKEAIGDFKNWGTNNTIGGGAAGGAVLGGVAGLIYEAIRSRKEGERKNYLRSMLTHALLGAAGGALAGNYAPSVVTEGFKAIPS